MGMIHGFISTIFFNIIQNLPVGGGEPHDRHELSIRPRSRERCCAPRLVATPTPAIASRPEQRCRSTSPPRRRPGPSADASYFQQGSLARRCAAAARLRTQLQGAAELACSRRAAAAAHGAPLWPIGGRAASGCVARAAQPRSDAQNAPARLSLSTPGSRPTRSLRSLGRAAGHGRADAVPEVPRR